MPPRPETTASDATRALVGAGQTLHVDAVAREAVNQLRAAGVPSILLKGRAFARELYDTPGERGYADCDLLVRRSDLTAAEAALAARGFARVAADFEDALGAHQQHAHEWRHPEAAVTVEVHWSLIGVEGDPDALWAALAPHVRPLRLGDAAIDALAGPGTAWLAALHAAQHGRGDVRRADDLTRALARLDGDVWREAAALARRTGSTGAFALGLGLVEAGRGRRAELGLDDAGEATTEARLLAAGAPGGALGIAELARTRGAPARARLVLRTLFPPPGVLRAYGKPLAGRGAAGLAAAYLLRPLDLAARLGPALAAWRRGRRVV